MKEVFDVIELVLYWLAAGFAALTFLIVFALPWWWGVVDMLGCKRFAGKPQYDTTAAILHWWEVKSLFATQAESMIKLFPWLGMDLSEDRGVTEEDGEVT